MLPKSIQTKISFTLIGLLLIGMILVDLVLIKVLQNQLVVFEGQRISYFLQQLQKQLDTNKLVQRIQNNETEDLLGQTPWPPEDICFAMGIKKDFFSTGACRHSYVLKQKVWEAVRTGRKIEIMIGKIWAVFQHGAQFICVTSPIRNGDKIIGALGIVVPLAPIYAILRSSQTIFLFYLLINTAWLSAGGYYVIGRIFMRPIKRLVSRAQQYDQDEEVLFAVRLEDGELNKLSIALNQMMDRISKDREKLQENVAALKEANDDLMQAQKKMVRAEKLASVGRLSAGIAHEIGNPIGIILGYLELLKSEEQSKEERGDCLTRAEAEVLRINTIIRQLLNFSRPIKGEPISLSIHKFFLELIEGLKFQPLLRDIQIDLSTSAEADQVMADPDHLRQVCLNLLINASDAIKSSANKGNGLIQITTFLKCHGGEDAHLSEMIEIRFSDNGTGIQEADLQNIFDPFYTTKEPGKGTGLGLSVSLTLIEQMGGFLTAESTFGKGATMKIALPLHK